MEHAQPALIVLGRAPGDYLSPDSAWKAHQHYTECGCEAGCWARDANLVVPGRTFWETNKIGGLKFRVAPLLYTYPRRVDTLTIFAHSHLACICFGLTSAVTFTVIRNSLRVCYELNTNTNIVVHLSWSRTRIPQHGISNSFIPDKNRSLVCIRRVTVCQKYSQRIRRFIPMTCSEVILPQITVALHFSRGVLLWNAQLVGGSLASRPLGRWTNSGSHMPIVRITSGRAAAPLPIRRRIHPTKER